VTLPIKPTEGGTLLFVRLTPKASRNALGEVVVDHNQQAWLKVYVTTVPEAGKANKALIQLLAKIWKIPSSHMDIVSGLTDRQKIIKIHGVNEENVKSLLP
jgi:uncharacterized protein